MGKSTGASASGGTSATRSTEVSAGVVVAAAEGVAEEAGGGWTGKGWGQGTQSHLDYLPEHTTDFVFAVLSEEFGWIGVAVVLALYLFVIGRCLWIAMEARDTYSRLLAGSLGLAFFVYVLVNGGMVSGLLPVVGVPIPLLSHGATPAVSLLAGLDLVVTVRTHMPVPAHR